MAYTPEFRAQALVTLEANEGNVLRTSEQLGIGEATLRTWVAENNEKKTDLALAAAEIIPDARAGFIEKLKSVRNKVLDHLDAIVPDLKAREAAITLGILIDKTELLEGNVTARTAVVGNGETVDEAIKRLTNELESRPSRVEIPEMASSEQGSSEAESISTAGDLV